MTTTKIKALEAEARECLTEARSLAGKADAERRSMTTDEEGQFVGHMAKGKDLLERIKTAKADQAVLDHARDLALEIGDPNTDSDSNGGYASKDGAKVDRRAWASKAADRVLATAKHYNVKALTSGSIDVPALVAPGVAPLGQAPQRLIDVIVNRVALTGGREYAFLQETVRTLNATVVADGGTKPTTVNTFAEVSGKVVVIATLSEAIPERFFADHAGLVQVLEGNLGRAVLDALEEEILTGDGTGEHLEGILEVSGTVAQAWSTDLLTTTRKAKSALTNAGIMPTAWALSVADVETLELLRNNEGNYYNGGPYGPAERSLWGVPYFTSPQLSAGTAILGDFNQCALYVREDLKLDADRSGTLFTTNSVKLRVEGRYGFGVHQPGAFAIVETAE